VTPEASPCPHVQAWPSRSRRRRRFWSHRCCLPPIHGERRLQAPSWSIDLVLTPSSISCSRGTQRRPPEFTGAPSPLKDHRAPPSSTTSSLSCRLGELFSPPPCLAPPPYRCGTRREDRTTSRPTPRRHAEPARRWCWAYRAIFSRCLGQQCQASSRIWPKHCSSVYSFLEFVFHLKFLGNSFKVQKFLENEIDLRKI
jgi:hypothetical protein